MTLTVCVGSSGSGKTYFLNEVYESHKCTYIRQFHNMRPYITVCKIPGFDPTQLPFWDIYEREGTAGTIMAGGTMAGQFTAGLSGGQRKMLLFELIVQRTANQADLLIVLDEPFAGVTDDFVPFITERLHRMSQKHNILLVTNDHVETLLKQADNTITVSAIDRSTLKVNEHEKVAREKVILAMSLGDDYSHNLSASHADLKFFWDVEVAHNGALMGIAVFTIFTFGLFLLTFWDSSEESGALVLIAGGIIGFFSINPYLLALVEWRNAMNEEAAALVHASKGMNKALKTVVTISLIFIISWIEYGVVNAVVDGFKDIEFWVAMFFDSMSLTFSLICLGLFSHLDFQTAQILGSLPFLLMIFLSTTFSPGSGVPVLKELRYLFARFYFWCMVPAVQDSMEGCPSDFNLLYLILSALIGLVSFLVVIGILKIKKGQRKSVQEKSRRASMMDSQFQRLQKELYGDKLKRLKHMKTSQLDSSVAKMPAPDLADESSEQPAAQNSLVEREAPANEEEADDLNESIVQPTAEKSVKTEAQAEDAEFWC